MPRATGSHLRAGGRLAAARRERDGAGRLGKALEGYAAALRASPTRWGDDRGRGRDNLMRAYTQLAEADARSIRARWRARASREAIIVHALLQQVPEVRKITIDKIYAAGLTSLDTLFFAKADEISATTGIGEELASTHRREVPTVYARDRRGWPMRLAPPSAQRLGELCGRNARPARAVRVARRPIGPTRHSQEKKLMRQARASRSCRSKCCSPVWERSSGLGKSSDCRSSAKSSKSRAICAKRRKQGKRPSSPKSAYIPVTTGRRKLVPWRISQLTTF